MKQFKFFRGYDDVYPFVDLELTYSLTTTPSWVPNPSTYTIPNFTYSTTGTGTILTTSGTNTVNIGTISTTTTSTQFLNTTTTFL